MLEFYDDGYSGVSFERPGIQKLLALAGDTVKAVGVMPSAALRKIRRTTSAAGPSTSSLPFSVPDFLYP